MSIRMSLFSLSVVALFAGVCSLALAADKNAAVTDPALADEDFHVQGEYHGNVNSEVWGSGRIGLQVIARGDGRFDAVTFRGGLPGNGWNRQDKAEYRGERAGDGVVLVGEHDSITLINYAGGFYNDAAHKIGSVRKVNRVSPTMGLQAPADAMVLFDGTSAENFSGGKVTSDGLLLAGGLTKVDVGDFRLHLEFRTPYKPHASGQQRGNSGVYIQERYEVQILDSFGLEGVANEAGGLYRQRAPEVNMALPPLAWQTYDIRFRAARWNDKGEKTENARISVFHNGIAVQNDVELTNKTGAGKKEENTRRPIRLQDHGNPVAFRNIWIVLGEGG